MLICDFPACLHPPEMVKKRPVVLRKPLSKYDTVLIVPVSTTRPNQQLAHHVLLNPIGLPPRMRNHE